MALVTVGLAEMVKCEGGCGSLVRPENRFCDKCADYWKEFEAGPRWLANPTHREWLEVAAMIVGYLIVFATMAFPWMLGVRDILRRVMGSWW